MKKNAKKSQQSSKPKVTVQQSMAQWMSETWAEKVREDEARKARQAGINSLSSQTSSIGF